MKMTLSSIEQITKMIFNNIIVKQLLLSDPGGVMLLSLIGLIIYTTHKPLLTNK